MSGYLIMKMFAKIVKGFLRPFNEEGSKTLAELNNKLVEVKLKENRTLSQNALFHMWCGIAADFFKIKGATKKQQMKAMKAAFKHILLGYESIIVHGKLTIDGQLKHTSELNSADMFQFMTKVDVWCQEKGLYLPHPDDTEYAKLKEKNS